MKHTLNDFKKGLTIWFGIMLMVWVVWWAYATLSSLTVNSTDTLTADLWNNLVEHSVPTGFVWAFNLSACPTWWIPADGTNSTPDLRWTFIRWMNWSLNSRDVARTLWSYQADDFLSHLHSVNPPSTTSSSAGNHRHTYIYYRTERQFGDGGARAIDYDQGSTTGNTGYAGTHTHTTNIAAFNSASSGWTETRPKNVALLYCVKD